MSTSESAYTWSPPTYNVSRPPTSLYKVHLVPNEGVDDTGEDFVRLAKWCPDGSSALAQCESGHLQFLNLPPEILDMSLSSQETLTLMPRTRQAAPVLDFAWYPSATCRDPASFCFVSSVRESPVKLLDASDGRLRASYKIVDHRERQIAPHSLAFNPSASKLYCGFEDAIEVFDVHYPGEGTRLHTTPSKKSRDGLKGIISTLAFAPDLSSGVYAAGSLNPSPANSSNVALFSEATGDTPLMFVGEESNGTFGIRSSAMQVMFSPSRPHLLYASFRRHEAIYCWDVRGDVGVPVQKLVKGIALADGETSSGADMRESHGESTNQKMRFDIGLSGEYLSVGHQDGNISVFHLGVQSPNDQNSDQSTIISAPTLKYRAHEDAVGSVGFHPLRPLLLSVSGSRHFTDGSSDTGDENSDGDEDEVEETLQLAEEGRRTRVTRSLVRPKPSCFDNSIQLWEF